MDRNILLIVDDIELNRILLRNVFEQEYTILEAENGDQALFLIEQYKESIAAVLLDVVMPIKNGYEVLEKMGQEGLADTIPVIVVTSRDSSDDEVRAFDLGAVDLITKPFEPHVISRRVHNAVELNSHRQYLENIVEEQAISLQKSTDVLVDALSSVIEHRSIESGQHVLRIRMFTKVLLEDVMNNYPEYGLNDYEVVMISSAASLHDIGKIAISDAILKKPGKLTAEEFEIMKTHAEKGSEILSVLDPIHDKKYLQYAYNICLYHHERWDGKGYPKGLVGDNIPICAQAVSIADVYDALTTERVYKPPYTPETAFSMILNGECGQFSPKLLESFKNVFHSFVQLTHRYADGQSPNADFKKSEFIVKKPEINLSTSDLGQMKYYTLLRYLGSTVIEVDIDTGVYHMTYKQNGDFDLFTTGGMFFETYNNFILNCTYHTDQVDFDSKVYFDDFIASGALKKSRKYRVFHRASREYIWYEVTVLRTNLDNPMFHKLMIVWSKILAYDEEVKQRRASQLPMMENSLVAVMRCRNDQWATITAINDGFFALFGYDKAEIEQLFKNKYIEMINPTDKKRAVKNVRKLLNSENFFEIEYRAQTKDGRTVWILDKSQLFVGADGNEYINSILTDITTTKQEQEELRLSVERYQILMEQSNDIIFEWDIRENKITYSKNWGKKYGYTPISNQLDLYIAKSSHVHPEDTSNLLTLMDKVSAGEPYGEVELRIADAQGRYIWNRLRATTQFNQNGTPVKAVGVLMDIDREKQHVQTLVDKADRDPLTKLFNKTASRRNIERMMKLAESNMASAMIIIDLDNFKNINDTRGHMFGDAVLIEAAAWLKLLFRPSDILARIGGDEFLVYMNDLASKNVVCNRAEKLVDTVRGIFQDELKDCSLSCSIGIAYFPDDASSYQTLFQCCDKALYQAKSLGKNQYAVFEQEIMNTQLDTVPYQLMMATTRIESDEFHDIDTAEMIHDTFRILYQTVDVDKAVQCILTLLGEKYQLSRAYLFEQVDNADHYKKSVEWSANGLSTSQEEVQSSTYANIININDIFDENGIFYCSDIARLPQEQDKMIHYSGVQATLQCGLYDNGEFVGFVGFDSAEIRLWTQSQISVLTFLSEWLSAFLLKKRAQEKLTMVNNDLRNMLDAQNAWIYVIDPESYILKYINARACRLTSDVSVGMYCYEAFMGRKAPCENCSAKLYKQTDKKMLEVYNEMLDLWMLADASAVQWDGEDSCMIACYDITPYKKQGDKHL